MLRRLLCFAPLAALLGMAAGCGSDVEKTYPVSGTVTLDGEPLADGEIYFVTPATGQIDILSIENGKFAGEAKAGSRRVEIRAYRVIEAQAADMPGYDPGESKENYLPAKYNDESTLNAEISADSPNDNLTFELESDSGGA
jgi:hypothetical protein